MEVTARFELVSPNLNGHNLRWARGPFCALDLTFTLLPEGNLFPLQYPGTWEAVVLTEIEFVVSKRFECGLCGDREFLFRHSRSWIGISAGSPLLLVCEHGSSAWASLVL